MEETGFEFRLKVSKISTERKEAEGEPWAQAGHQSPTL